MYKYASKLILSFNLILKIQDITRPIRLSGIIG